MNHQLTPLLSRHGFTIVRPINQDHFDRFHAVVSDNQGRKYFVKAVIGKKSYSYKSLLAEAYITDYLSKITQSTEICYKNYRLQIPQVKMIIVQDQLVCLVTSFIEGKRLLDQSPVIQASTLLIALHLLALLSKCSEKQAITKFLKNYSPLAFSLRIPLQLAKAITISPHSTLSLVKIALKTLPLFHERKFGLVHADINASNIWLRDNLLYLTDWEEAGWGITDYNTVGPLSVHWNIPAIRNKLFSMSLVPILAYRILVLFSQRLDPSDNRRKRDLLLLKEVVLGNFRDTTIRKK